MLRFTFLLIASFSTTLCVFAQSNLQLIDLISTASGSAADYELVLSARVGNSSSDTLSVRASRSVISSGFSSQNYFCWDACYDPSKSISDYGLTIPNGESIGSFTGHLRPNGYVGTTSIRYCFFNADLASDSVCFVGRFETAAVGINDPLIVSSVIVYPNPASEFSTISYSLPTPAKNGRLEILNMLGAKLYSQPITSQNGQLTVPVSELESGVYFYSIISDGQPQRTGKFNVKH